MAEAFQCDRCKGYFDQRMRTELKVDDGKFVMVFGFLRPLSEEEIALYQQQQQTSAVTQFFASDTPKYQQQDLCEACQKELIYLALLQFIKEAKHINHWDNVLKEIQK